MSIKHFALPASFDGQARLFPLPGVVLFPSNVVPLHIFESRYREMLEDAIQGDQLITLATLLPGYEPDYYSRPPLAPVVCIGRVVGHEKTKQGTYNLILVGLQRARIEHEIEPVRSFRRARVTILEDQVASANRPAADAVGRTLATRVREAFPATEKVIDEFDRGRISLRALTDVLSFHLPLDTEYKLRLLGELDAVTRARLLLAMLPAMDNTEANSRRYPAQFSLN